MMHYVYTGELADGWQDLDIQDVKDLQDQIGQLKYYNISYFIYINYISYLIPETDKKNIQEAEVKKNGKSYIFF